MPPRDIFVVRHGERRDHKEPIFSLTTDRPHDPPLTENGIEMAVQLGKYMAQHYKVDPSSLVILTSPLLRCVQTSDGIVRGVCAGAQGRVVDVPVYLEPGIAEGAYWIFYDMKRNPDISSEKGGFHCPDPIFRSAEYYHKSVSGHVRLDKPYSLGCDPVHVVEDNQLREPQFSARILKAGKSVLSEPTFDGKTVVLVAHGETTLRLFDSITAVEKPSEMVNPPYTAFVYLTKEPAGESSGESSRWSAAMSPFTTPHLPEVPSES